MSKVSKAYAGPLEDAVEDILRSKKYLNSTNHFILNRQRQMPSM